MSKGVYPRSAKHNLANKLSKLGQANPKGEDAGRAILTETEVIEIRMMHGKGLASMASLAQTFNTSKSNVLHIIHRHSWRHI